MSIEIENIEPLEIDTRPRTMAEGAAARLRADIVAGVLEPGAKLAMQDLTARYGVGMSPVREALARLVGEGLVESEGQRGFRVSGMSAADIAEIWSLRQAVEEFGIRAAIEKGDAEWEARLVAAYQLLEKRTGELTRGPFDDRFDAYETAHKAFHLALLEGAGSRRLTELQRRLYDDAARYRRRGYRKLVPELEDGFRLGADMHKALLDAVLARDTERAVTLLKAHLALIPVDGLDLK